MELELETGEVGKLASGAVMIRGGGTVVYTTVCHQQNLMDDGFLPLTVNYSERFSAAGKTRKGFNKGEGRYNETEVLISRLIDRPLRPMFDESWKHETQVHSIAFSYDGTQDPGLLAITSSAASLLISDAAFKTAVAGVRVGYIEGQGLIINPQPSQLEKSKLDLVMAGTETSILMIEGFADFVSKDLMLQAIAKGQDVLKEICQQMQSWAIKVQKQKLELVNKKFDASFLQDQILNLVQQDLKNIYRKHPSKQQMQEQIGKVKEQVRNRYFPNEDSTVSEEYKEQLQDLNRKQLDNAFKDVLARILRNLILDENLRVDGRGLEEIRNISIQCQYLEVVHGSCLFTRGETQAMCVATLGSQYDQQAVDSLTKNIKERFYLDYYFLPSSVGEVRRIGGMQNRREVGHGQLAQRALEPIIPDAKTYPYTMRLESTITMSNGSSSMASVCAGCLALKDAGVPIKRIVAGIAMGLILEKNDQYVILSDILGQEDASGDMDFKVAGDEQHISAFQMDIKVQGITIPIIKAALEQAERGRQHILNEMKKSQPTPLNAHPSSAPYIVQYKVTPKDKIGTIIGSQGRTIRQLQYMYKDVKIFVQEEQDEYALVEIAGSIKQEVLRCLENIQRLTEDLHRGDIIRNAVVMKVTSMGVDLEICPLRKVFLHISEINQGPSKNLKEFFPVGKQIDIMVTDTNDFNEPRVSQRQLHKDKDQEAQNVYSRMLDKANQEEGQPDDDDSQEDRANESQSPKGRSLSRLRQLRNAQ